MYMQLLACNWQTFIWIAVFCSIYKIDIGAYKQRLDQQGFATKKS